MEIYSGSLKLLPYVLSYFISLYLVIDEDHSLLRNITITISRRGHELRQESVKKG